MYGDKALCNFHNYVCMITNWHCWITTLYTLSTLDKGLCFLCMLYVCYMWKGLEHTWLAQKLTGNLVVAQSLTLKVGKDYRTQRSLTTIPTYVYKAL